MVNDALVATYCDCESSSVIKIIIIYNSANTHSSSGSILLCSNGERLTRRFDRPGKWQVFEQSAVEVHVNTAILLGLDCFSVDVAFYFAYPGIQDVQGVCWFRLRQLVYR